MSTCVAFLRGINLGSTNKISMAELRSMAEELGYADVATYINSGNLVLHTSKTATTVERELAQAISNRFGHKIDVVVRTLAQLEKILAQNPFPDGNPSQVTVAFLTKAPPPQAKPKLAAIAAEHEPFQFAGKNIYVNYSQGLGRSKLAEKFSSIVGVSSTVRNIRTVEKVVDLCKKA
jgi:uncharacterized protein (DUF1697 family)